MPGTSFRSLIALALALTLACGALLAACGDDDGDGSGDGAASPLDAACVDGAERLTELTTEQGAPFVLADAREYLPEQIAIEEDVLAELEDAGAPKGRQAEFDEWTDTRAQRIESLEQQLARAEAKDVNGYKQVENETEALEERGYRQAAALELMACAGELSSEQAAELEVTIMDIFTTGDPAHCTEDYTENYVERQAGTDGLCEQLERTQQQASDVEIHSLHGVEDVNGVAVITLTGTDEEPATFRVNFIRDEDRWKLDSHFQVAPPK